jgi:hypothetical protein
MDRQSPNLYSVISVNSIEEAAERLAVINVAAQEKRAAMRIKIANPLLTAASGVSDLAQPLIGNVRAAAQPYIDRATDMQHSALSVSPDLGKHLRWGLGGAGAGAALGLGSQLLAPEKKRRPLSAMLTGAFIGGSGGVAGSVVDSHLPAIRNFFSPSPAEKDDLLRRQHEIAKTHENAGVTNPEIQASGEAYGTDPGRMSELGSMANRFGRDTAYKTFVEQMTRKSPTGESYRFRLPQTADGKPHSLASRLTPLAQEKLEPLGFKPEHIANVVDEEGEKALANTVLQSPGNYLRSIADPKKPDVMQKVPYKSYNEALAAIQQARKLHAETAGQYGWNQPDQQALYSVLDHMRGEADKSGLTTASGRRSNEFWQRFDPDHWDAVARSDGLSAGLRKSPLGVTGVQNLLPNRREEGLFAELARAHTGANLKNFNLDDPRFAFVRKSGVNPAELMEAYSNGPEAIRTLANRMIGEGRKNSEGKPWTNEEELTRHLTQQSNDVRRFGKMDDSLWDSLRGYSTGNTARDVIAPIAAADALGLSHQAIQSLRGMNPKDLAAMLERGESFGGLESDAMNYLRAVKTQHNEEGLARVLAGERVPINTTLNQGTLPAAIDAWRQQSAEAANKLRPTYSPDLLAKKVNAHMSEFAQKVNPVEWASIQQELAKGSISVEDAQQRMAQLLKLHGADQLSGGLNARQVLAMRDEAERILDAVRNKRMDSGTAQSLLETLAKKGLDRPGLAGKFDFNTFQERLGRHLGPQLSEDFKALPQETQQQLFDQLSRMGDSGKEFGFKLPRAGTRGIADPELIAKMRELAGSPGGPLGRGVRWPNEIGEQDLAAALKVLRDNSGPGNGIHQTPHGVGIPLEHINILRNRAQEQLAESRVSIPTAQAKSFLGELTGARPDLEVPGSVWGILCP